MSRIGSKLRKTCVAAAIAASFGVAGAAQAGTIQLGFILDGSGSIGAGNWTTIVNGLSAAINTLIPISGPDQYEINVVSFGSGAVVNIDGQLITDASSRTAVANTIAGLPFLNGGSTNYNAAFSAMVTALTTGPGVTPGAAVATYVNFATDGQPNDGGTPSISGLLGAGVDNISVEGIGGGVNAGYLQTNICYPQPCSTSTPFNFPTQGFYIAVADAQGYANAIDLKIRTVTNQVPEPATLALMGVALAGIGFSRRREKA